MTVQAAGGEMPLSAWLREQREARGWSGREQARRLIRAGRDAGDSAMPSLETMCRNVRRWERGHGGITERYKLHYCKTLGIPVAGFGVTAPGASALSPVATVSAHGLSVSAGYVSGRLVIEVSGLEAEDGEPEPGPGLSLVASQDRPGNYGGRA
jgi:hypothetical protein